MLYTSAQNAAEFIANRIKTSRPVIAIYLLAIMVASIGAISV